MKDTRMDMGVRLELECEEEADDSEDRNEENAMLTREFDSNFDSKDEHCVMLNESSDETELQTEKYVMVRNKDMKTNDVNELGSCGFITGPRLTLNASKNVETNASVNLSDTRTPRQNVLNSSKSALKSQTKPKTQRNSTEQTLDSSNDTRVVINKLNINEMFPVVEQAIRSATFVSLSTVSTASRASLEQNGSHNAVDDDQRAAWDSGTSRFGFDQKLIDTQGEMRMKRACEVMQNQQGLVLEVSLTTFRRVRPQESTKSNPKDSTETHHSDQTSRDRAEFGELGATSSVHPTENDETDRIPRASAARYVMRTFTFQFLPPEETAVSFGTLSELLERGVSIDKNRNANAIKYELAYAPNVSSGIAGINSSRYSSSTLSTNEDAVEDLFGVSPGDGSGASSRSGPQDRSVSVQQRVGGFHSQVLGSPWPANVHFSDVSLMMPALAQGPGAALLRLISASCVPVVVFDSLEDLLFLCHSFHTALVDPPSSSEKTTWQTSEFSDRSVRFTNMPSGSPRTKSVPSETLVQLLRSVFPRIVDCRYVSACHFMEEFDSLDDLSSQYHRADLQSDSQSESRESAVCCARDQSSGDGLSETQASGHVKKTDASPGVSAPSEAQACAGDTVAFQKDSAKRENACCDLSFDEHENDEEIALHFAVEDRIEGLLKDSFDSPMTSVHRGTLFSPEQGHVRVLGEEYRGKSLLEHVTHAAVNPALEPNESKFRVDLRQSQSAMDGISRHKAQTTNIDALRAELQAVSSNDSTAECAFHRKLRSRLENVISKLEKEDGNVNTSQTVHSGPTARAEVLHGKGSEPMEEGKVRNNLKSGELQVVSRSTSMMELAEKLNTSQRGGNFFNDGFYRIATDAVDTSSVSSDLLADKKQSSGVRRVHSSASFAGQSSGANVSMKANDSVLREGVEMSRCWKLGTGSAKESEQIGFVFATFAERVGWANVTPLFEGQLWSGKGSGPVLLRGSGTPMIPKEATAQDSERNAGGISSITRQPSASLFQSTNPYLFNAPSMSSARNASTIGPIGPPPGSIHRKSAPLSDNQSLVQSFPASVSSRDALSGSSSVFGERVSSSSIRMGYLNRLGLHHPFDTRLSTPNSDILPSEENQSNAIQNRIGATLPSASVFGDSFRLSDTSVALVDRLVDVLTPNQFSESLRTGIFQSVAMLIKRALNGQSFCFGTFSYKTYLAQSTLDVGAFCVAHDDTITANRWCTKLMAALCESAASLMISESSESNETEIDNKSNTAVADELVDMNGDEEQSLWKASSQAMQVYNISFKKREAELAPVVTFMCRGGVRVRVSLNQVGAMNHAFFVDEVDRLVGKQHLLKRSMLLVSAWCMYGARISSENLWTEFATGSNASHMFQSTEDTADEMRNLNPTGFGKVKSVSGTSQFHHGLSTSSIEALVLFLFNAYSSSIDSPLDALFKFINVYARLDWASYGVCIHGPVRLRDGAIVSFGTGAAQTLLLSSSFLNSFGRQQVTSENVSLNAETPSNGDIPTQTFSHVVQTTPALESVVYGSMNIFSPLDGNTNLCAYMTRESIGFIAQGFQKGVKDINAFVQQPSPSLLHKMMGSAASHHLHIWKEVSPNLGLLLDRALNEDDASYLSTEQNHQASYTEPLNARQMLRPMEYLHSAGALRYFTDSDPLLADSTALRNNLEYVRFIVDSQVTELGLLAFLMQVLAENGSLLIGEIGQHLRSTFGRQDWGAVLKERFGGLKRFLLKHADLFFVDNDHPLNPHIYLRSYQNGPVIRDTQAPETSAESYGVSLDSSQATALHEPDTSCGNPERSAAEKKREKKKKAKANATKLPNPAAVPSGAAVTAASGFGNASTTGASRARNQIYASSELGKSDIPVMNNNPNRMEMNVSGMNPFRSSSTGLFYSDTDSAVDYSMNPVSNFTPNAVMSSWTVDPNHNPPNIQTGFYPETSSELDTRMQNYRQYDASFFH
uniref:PAP/OAS1 substrate-binding-related domain-containing protein n=1 Tax=Timspurckia oligopyrenoides TaxID=708627 RepID=A0A7S1EU80_9RHOD|mmetsp:Transcript_9169/g.16496  ORF Transcript_9169/g.16496 Transcript_9169/m.16496 type:complete len:1948 (+) Transcript_9169:1-5844(+)